MHYITVKMPQIENIIREFHLNQVFTKANGAGGDTKEDKKSK